MTISFKSTDSLYKIFSTLKKLPPYKKVTVVLPERHEIFNHARRGQQLHQVVTEYHLDIRFMVSSREHSNYFELLGLSVTYEKPHGWFMRVINTLKKIIHGDTPGTHKKVVSWLIIIAEIAIFILLGSFFWGVISPKATVIINPNAKIRPITYKYLIYPSNSGFVNNSVYTNPLAIPYEQITIEYTTSLPLDIAEITYTTTPAKGNITITNTLPSSYSLLAGTQFITDQGFIYRSDTSIELQEGSVESPSILSVPVTADPVSESGIRQGEESNILQGTRLLIRNLSESRVLQGIRATSDENFVGGSIDAQGVVSQSDIEKLKQKLIETMDANKKNYLNQATQDDNEYINLPFDQFIEFTPTRFETDAQQGDDLIQIEGTVTGELSYYRISRSALLEKMQEYMSIRPLLGYRLLNTDVGSLRMYDLMDTPITGQYFMPTRLNTIRGYDFVNDNNGIRSEIVQRILGLPREEAKKIILSYEQALDVEITMSPPWYDILPESVERISVEGRIE